MSKLKLDAKFLVALVLSACGALVTALGTGGGSFHSIDGKHWIIAALAVLGSAGLVGLIDNISGIAGGIARAAVAFLSAGLASVVVALNDSVITQAEYVTAFSAAVAAAALVYHVGGGTSSSSPPA